MGKPLSDEHKKAISEALRKKYGVDINAPDTVTRSPEAQTLYSDYAGSVKNTGDLMLKRDELLAKNKAMGRKKTSKAARAKIKEQVKKINEKLKAEREKRMELKTKAMQAKRVKLAQLNIAKGQARLVAIDGYGARAAEMASKAKTPEGKQRAKETAKRIEAMRKAQNATLSKYEKVIADKGVSATTGSGAFNFDEVWQCDLLGEQPFAPFRDLTLQEKRSDLKGLNDTYNEIQSELEDNLSMLTKEQIDTFLKAAHKRLEAKDIAALAALVLLLRTAVKKAIDYAAVLSYEAGKKLAAQELNVDRPPTPNQAAQIRSFDTDQMAQTFTDHLENVAKATMIGAIVAGATTEATVAATRAKMQDAASKMITNVSGNVAGQYVNRGRREVFAKNAFKITKYQRSEVLDGKTCNMCQSLDKRVVAADDPMASLDFVHSHCRGIWVPVLSTDTQPELDPIPAGVIDSFDLVGDKPIVNGFKQLKKPITNDNKGIADEIKNKI